MIPYYAICVIVFFGPGVSHGLRWHPSGFVNDTDTVISLQITSRDPSIDIYRGRQITILKDVKTYGHTINIYCFIGGYDENMKILYSFCKDSACLLELNDDMILEREVYGIMIKASAKVSGQKGMKLELKLPTDDKDVSGNYYCTATDNASRLKIISNYVQIRDVNYWMTHQVTIRDHSKRKFDTVINRSDLPITFKCDNGNLVFNNLKPKWINEEIPVPVEWSVCPVRNNFQGLQENQKMTFSKCKLYTTVKWTSSDQSIRPRKLNEMKEWSYLINRKGELKIFDFNFIDKEISYAFMCYVKRNQQAEQISTYFTENINDLIIKGITFDGSISSNNKLFILKSEPIQHVIIYARKIPPTVFNSEVQAKVIYVEYSASSQAKFDWFYNGDRIESGMNRIVEKYKITFKHYITLEMAGNYSIVIVDQSEKKMMSILVTVLELPKSLNSECLPLIHHVWENDDLRLSCVYMNNVKEFKIFINNYQITRNFTTTKLAKIFPNLENMTYEIQLTPDFKKYQTTLKYNLFKLKTIHGQKMSEDHSVTFRVENKLGFDVKSTSVYVIPRIDTMIESYPKLQDCSIQCQIQCRLKLEPYKNKELLLKLYWTVNEYKVNSTFNESTGLLSYFSMNTFSNNLTVNYSLLSQYVLVKPTLNLIQIVCHIDLISAESNKYFYKSVNDKNLKEKLEIRIYLNKSNAASTTIIVTVILILLLFTIVVFLVFRMKYGGETYKISTLEQKLGYNQERELEDEVFQPYEFMDYETRSMSTSSVFTVGSSPFDELGEDNSETGSPKIIYKTKSRKNIFETVE